MLPKNIRIMLTKYPPFHQKVWLACAGIPKGKTQSYGEIAKMIGHPGAARAVGNALAKNPFAPIVPCHRVIKQNGELGGFSAKGGTKRKAQLLKGERK